MSRRTFTLTPVTDVTGSLLWSAVRVAREGAEGRAWQGADRLVATCSHDTSTLSILEMTRSFRSRLSVTNWSGYRAGESTSRAYAHVLAFSTLS